MAFNEIHTVRIAGAAGTVGSLGNRDATTVAGNAATEVISTATTGRTGIAVHNTSSTYQLWVRLVAAGAATPTISSTNRDFVIDPEATLVIGASDRIDVYIQNSSGGAGTTNYTATELIG